MNFLIGILIAATIVPTEGRAIYEHAEGLTARISDSNLELDGASFPCVNCHGPLAQGRSEGGIAMPAIRPNDLQNRYDLEAGEVGLAFINIVTKGIRPDGEAVSSAMPRYDMSAEEVANLIEYLENIEGEAGLDRTIIWLSKPASDAAAKALLAGLKSCSPAGIYGREFDLRDDGLLGEEDYAEISEKLVGAEWAAIDENLAGQEVRFLNENDRELLPHAIASDGAENVLITEPNAQFAGRAKRYIGRASVVLPIADKMEAGLVSTVSQPALALAMVENMSAEEMQYYDIGSVICGGFLQAGRRANLDDIRIFIDATDWQKHVSLAQWSASQAD